MKQLYQNNNEETKFGLSVFTGRSKTGYSQILHSNR